MAGLQSKGAPPAGAASTQDHFDDPMETGIEDEDGVAADQPEQNILASKFVDTLWTNIAHDVKYADLGTGRSLARQVCGLDEQLPWASTQFTTVDNLQNYAKTGTLLALLAIGCWLATTLREVFNISGFVAALRGYEAGPCTVLVESEEGDEVKIATMSRGRRNMLFIFVAFPRLLVAFVLMDTGTRYLANTIALEDLNGIYRYWFVPRY
eukprot:s3639_g1.t1